MEIAIVGGAGRMGQLLVRMLSANGHRILIGDTDEDKGRRLAQLYNVGYSNDNLTIAKTADIVIVSVPTERTAQVISEVCSHMKRGSLLIDIASMKVDPVNAMLACPPNDVELISCHPLFGGDIENLQEKNIVLINVRSSSWYTKVKHWLQERGANLTELSDAEEHDKIMSIVQGLTYITYMVPAGVLKVLNVDIEATRLMETPNYRTMLPLMYRMLATEVGSIQEVNARIVVYNRSVRNVIREFVNQAQLLEKLVEEENLSSLIEYLEEARDHLALSQSEHRLLFSMSKSAVYAIDKAIREFDIRKGSRVCVRHRASGAIHVGILGYKTDKKTIEIQTGRKEGSVFISRDSAELLSLEEEVVVRRERFGEKFLDFSALFPLGFDENLLPQIVSNIVKGVLTVELREVYRGPGIPTLTKSITIRTWFLGDEDYKILMKSVIQTLSRLDAKLR
jgi:prephenate dehydrogenase